MPLTFFYFSPAVLQVGLAYFDSYEPIADFPPRRKSIAKPPRVNSAKAAGSGTEPGVTEKFAVGVLNSNCTANGSERLVAMLPGRQVPVFGCTLVGMPHINK